MLSSKTREILTPVSANRIYNNDNNNYTAKRMQHSKYLSNSEEKNFNFGSNISIIP